MKVAARFGAGKAGLVDKPDPKAKEDFVLVKIHVVPICTEYKGLRSDRPGDHFGHEAVGEVVEVAQPGLVKVGDRVVIQPVNGCGRCPLCIIGENSLPIFHLVFHACLAVKIVIGCNAAKGGTPASYLDMTKVG